jgi:phage tail sheath gpL-like
LITIDDGVQAPVLYEYDKSGNGVTAGRVAVTVGGASTAAQVAARFALAIVANQGDYLNVVDNADGSLALSHKVAGTVGNETITETATDAGILVTGMSGGVNPTGTSAALPTDCEVHLLVIELRNASFNVES